jgi:hypothetical protein
LAHALGGGEILRGGRPAAAEQQVERQRAEHEVVVVELGGGDDAAPPVRGADLGAGAVGGVEAVMCGSGTDRARTITAAAARSPRPTCSAAWMGLMWVASP